MTEVSGVEESKRTQCDLHVRQMSRSVTGGSESIYSLAVAGGDGKEVSYLAIYNSEIDESVQAGIRVGRKEGGRSKDFVFDFQSGSEKPVERMRVTHDAGVRVSGTAGQPVVSLATGGAVQTVIQDTACTADGLAGKLAGYRIPPGKTALFETSVVGRSSQNSFSATLTACFAELDGRVMQVGETEKKVITGAKWVTRFLQTGNTVCVAVQAELGQTVSWCATSRVTLSA